jgi:deoxyadenosine/deoxycytidine kinase
VLIVHSVYNVAFALTEFRTDAFYETVREVQAVADARILKLPVDVPVVLTEILTEAQGAPSDFWSAECWQNVLSLAEERGPLLMVYLHCDLPENRRRIASEGRALKRKRLSPEMAERKPCGCGGTDGAGLRAFSGSGCDRSVG